MAAGRESQRDPVSGLQGVYGIPDFLYNAHPFVAEDLGIRDPGDKPLDPRRVGMAYTGGQDFY
jgi:hypothetical protein